MKIISVLLIAVMLICCNVKSNSEAKRLSAGSWGGDYYESGMHYVTMGNTNFAVLANVTKDSLECAYYKKMLSK